MGKKILAISACSEDLKSNPIIRTQFVSSNDLDTDKIYNVAGKYYISATLSEECVKCLEKEGIIQYRDILNEDQLAKVLEENGLEEIPDENIYEFEKDLHVKLRTHDLCYLF